MEGRETDQFYSSTQGGGEVKMEEREGREGEIGREREKGGTEEREREREYGGERD